MIRFPNIKRILSAVPILGRRLPEPEPIEPLLEEPRIDVDLLRSLGYPFEPPAAAAATTIEPLPPPEWPSGDLWFVTVCTVNHLPFTRTLIESIRRHHGAVPILVTVVDAPTRDAVMLDRAIVLTGRDVLTSDFDFFALKFDPSELCCVAKPCTIDYLLRHAPARRVVYIDSDVYLFAPLDAMLAKLYSADFVVTPHTFAPLPFPERFWERPSLGMLAGAGVFNAGMFAMRRGSDSERFIATWKFLCTSPGAFVKSQVAQFEQHAFNWISCFAESFVVLRDPAYNVAYWNLHDRSLRVTDGEGGEAQWLVDGEPLVAYHFSGYSPAAPFVLSCHQTRYDVYWLPAVARLVDFYRSRLEANDLGELGTRYAFDRFPSGIRIDALMREIFRNHELFLRADVNPFTEEGEAHYVRALLSPIPYTGSFAPVLAQEIRDQRGDLHVFENISLDPSAFLRWLQSGGAREQGYDRMLDLHRPAVPTHAGAQLLCELRERFPEIFDGLKEPIRAQRPALVARLRAVAPVEAEQIAVGAIEHYILSPIAAVRAFVSERADLLQAFPDLLFDDGPRLAEWLRRHRLEQHFLPADAIDAFEARTGGRPLARIYSFLSRSWSFMERWPLALAGEGSLDLARTLLPILQGSIEFDAPDIEMFLWIMEEKPWAGIALTLELPLHTTRHPSSRSLEGQNEILDVVLRRDERFVAALDEYRRRYPPVADHARPSERTAAGVSVFACIDRAPRKMVPPPDVAPGVNVFGYHRSEIGLGQMTRGFVDALHAAGSSTSSIVLGNVRMDDDLLPDDFIRTYDVAKGTNVMISYPHHHDSLIRSMPDEVVAGHRNIAYLAWEQQGGTHYWRDVYADFDQIWALSDFAAESLTSVLKRTVHSVPCVVDAASFPPPSTKDAHRLDRHAFTFLFVYDANSSTERKNPEGVVEAFRRAFRPDDSVRLVIKASSSRRLGNRGRLQRLLAAIGADPRIDVRVEHLGRSDLLGLISAADCYVSLHRGEGFGYTCAEAMAYGKPVIATGYSGNMQFMNDANSYPVRYREVEARVPEGPFQRGSIWAEPDVDHAAELMRRVFEQRDEAAARGKRGRITIETTLSPAAVGKRVRSLLADDGMIECVAGVTSHAFA